MADFFEQVKSRFSILTIRKNVKPQQNAVIERFNKTVREDLLDANLLFGIEHANVLAQEFMHDYNYERPHESLNDKTPVEYAA